MNGESGSTWLPPRGLVAITMPALVATGVYATLMLPVALRPPLRGYLLQVVDAVRRGLGFPAPLRS